jgi:hypothetical protein
MTEFPTDAMHKIANRHSQACMAAIGREVIKGAAGWQFGMEPQAFIREAIINALMDALAAKDPPLTETTALIIGLRYDAAARYPDDVKAQNDWIDRQLKIRMGAPP